MSQQPKRVVVVQQPVVRSNGLGIAGFVVSLVGLLGTCGLLSPLGLIFSLIAMFKRPRGFAIAGLILGLIGSAWMIIAVFFIGLTAIAAAVGIGVAVKQVQVNEDMDALGRLVNARIATGNPVPADFKGFSGANVHTTDPWGNSYRLVKKGDKEFDILSDGPDGEPSTSDDISWRDIQAGGLMHDASRAEPHPD